MSGRLLLTVLATCIALRADTLTLRNGSSVTGAWIDLDDRQITFRVNNHIQTYDRSEVAGIQFGASPASASETGSREPEIIGAVYFQDDMGKLVPLERKPLYEVAGKYRELEETASPVRLKFRPKMLFVVRLANGIDPAGWDLYPLETVKDGRRLRAHPRQAGLLTVLTTVTKFGESSYGIMADGNLAPGEYAFSSKTLKDAYCFAIDPE